MAALFRLPKQTLFDSNGLIAPNGSVRFFASGTSTPLSVFSDAGLTAPIAQPIPADSAGRLPIIYMPTGLFKVIIYSDLAGSIVVYTADAQDTGIPAGSGALPVANGGTGATTAAGARTNLLAASQTDLNTQAAALAVIQAAITALPGSALGAIAGLATLTRAYLATNFGSIPVQRAEVAATVAQATAATTIPYDNTIPQNTEGWEALNGNFTPVSATSTFEVRVDVMVSNANNEPVCVALFQDTIANALAARWVKIPAVNDVANASFIHRMASVSTAAIAFKVRIGGSSAATAINGTAAARVGGGVVRSAVTVIEYEAH